MWVAHSAQRRGHLKALLGSGIPGCTSGLRTSMQGIKYQNTFRPCLQCRKALKSVCVVRHAEIVQTACASQRGEGRDQRNWGDCCRSFKGRR